ncbi:unnamed protein product [Kuraishia capsulata CBS 1993]|uniref:Uncharacterized protein n=1 Tax=Kuraishia capsulata CBS 1993 TaxID=1382522 RepID=W6MTY0_9ASCO|nr:uncharacterized protein KUCA_T00005968001 [Kuraishia capsulata CBS 1993]CDK29973.1 unnamed protein product [Kuraishia capsulata CBS 1993]
MAVKEKARQLIKLLEKLPDDRVKHFASFKQTQIDKFNPIAGLQSTSTKKRSRGITDIVKTSVIQTEVTEPRPIKTDLYTEPVLDRQIVALKNILNDKHSKFYPLGDKLLRPKGNPNYYDRLVDNLTGEKKENFLRGMWTVVTGKY